MRASSAHAGPTSDRDLVALVYRCSNREAHPLSRTSILGRGLTTLRGDVFANLAHVELLDAFYDLRKGRSR